MSDSVVVRRGSSTTMAPIADNGSIERSLPHRCTLNGNTEEELHCYGYRQSLVRTILAHTVSILLLGIPYLVGRWKPKWKIRWFWQPCTLVRADTVLIKDLQSYTEIAIVPIITENANEELPLEYVHMDETGGNKVVNEFNDSSPLWAPANLSFKYFYHRHVKYIWNSSQMCYMRLKGLDSGTNTSKFSSVYALGLSGQAYKSRSIIYDLNSIKIEVKSYISLLFQEVLNPFYIFQIGSIILWSLDSYVFYAGCIFIVSGISITVSLLETRRQSQCLHDMVSSSDRLKVRVIRGGNSNVQEPVFSQEICSTQIVPGDVLVIPCSGCIMSCDAALIAGNCIVNEAMLTGESVPITKSALPQSHGDDDDEEIYEPEGKHKKHTLFAGTSVIQTRYYGKSHVLAVVVRTGFETAKGGLIRSILYPKPMGFKFYRDSMRFICVLLMLATAGMIYCICIYVKRGTDIREVILRCLDIVTIVVPPALPAAMTVGTYYAQNRLKTASSIFSISPQRINVCGKLKLVCFDKTGTLTEDGLDFWGVVPTSFGFRRWCSESDSYHEEKNVFRHQESYMSNLPDKCPIKICLASCHSLTLIDNKLIGDPLDIKMFQATMWSLEEPGSNDTSKFDMLMPSVIKPPTSEGQMKDGYFFDPSAKALDTTEYPHEIGIIRQFEFSSSTARMSVITRTLGDTHFHVYTKGAPEKIVELCLPESIPHNFHQLLKSYTLRGFRVIALACKVLTEDVNWLKVQKIKRDLVESQLHFLGFLVMQNMLKPQSKPVIQELKLAKIRSVMVTGDNLLTAVSVARDCNMVETRDSVIIVEAYAPISSGDQNARIRFSWPEEEESDSTTYNHQTAVQHLVTNSSRLCQHDVEEGRRGPEQQHDYHFAMNGRTWSCLRTYFPHLLPKLIRRGTIFARMSPDQKSQLIEELQSLDYVVCMCGDGANDCSALKAAHVGISLSEAEASVAAPFTSRIPNITCVPTIIKEGRCALVTSFGTFNYMALYSMVQFISILILYTIETIFGDTQFLYIDLAITTTVAILMGWGGPSPNLVAQRPSGSLISAINLFSIFSQILLSLVIQLGAYFYLASMPWYKKVQPSNPDEEIVVCQETTTIFVLSSFQYLGLAAVYSKGPPYRKPLYTNIPFVISFIVLIVFTAFLAVNPGTTLGSFFQIDPSLPMEYRRTMLAIAAINAVICFFIERQMVERRWLKSLLHMIVRKKTPKNKFKIIQQEMDAEGWPYALQCYSSTVTNLEPGIS